MFQQIQDFASNYKLKQQLSKKDLEGLETQIYFVKCALASGNYEKLTMAMTYLMENPTYRKNFFLNRLSSAEKEALYKLPQEIKNDLFAQAPVEYVNMLFDLWFDDKEYKKIDIFKKTTWAQCDSHTSVAKDIPIHHGIKYIALWIQNQQTTTELKIYRHYVFFEHLKPLLDALTVNNTLESLDISYSRLCVDGFVHLSKVLSNNKTLNKLYLRENFQDKKTVEQCIEHVINIIEQNNLEVLDLSFNSDLSPCLFKDALSKNTSLYQLDLSDMNIHLKQEDIQCLVDILNVNKTLTEIDFGCKRGFTNGRAEIIPVRIEEVESLLKQNKKLVFSAKIYSLLLLLSKEYAQLKTIEASQGNNPNLNRNMEMASKFFKMGLRLPPELQMLVCEMSQGLLANPTGIEISRITPALKKIVKGL